MIPHDQSFCPKCHRMYCEGYWGEGVCISDMHFCGEPTADGDSAAEYLRAWYEANREGWIERRKKRWQITADNLMLGLMNEMHRIECEREAQLKRQVKVE